MNDVKEAARNWLRKKRRVFVKVKEDDITETRKVLYTWKSEWRKEKVKA